ncbi:MAG: zf-TFIIB domain-containing protein [Chthonomonadaceae bacterium]|nr:zf-TFIIB domain-containing protein [Chthonomonadaceae bacterium]
MVPVERQGVEIDYCPGCRGVWLDRGELDKLSAAPPTPGFTRQQDFQRDERKDRGRDGDRDRRRDWDDDDDYRKKRKRNFLEDLLDFD